MKEYLQSQEQWLQVERLPGYSPDLNPVESLWGNIKDNELANQSADDLSEVSAGVHAGFSRILGQRELLIGFLNHSGLFLTNLSLYYTNISNSKGRFLMFFDISNSLSSFRLSKWRLS